MRVKDYSISLVSTHITKDKGARQRKDEGVTHGEPPVPHAFDPCQHVDTVKKAKVSKCKGSHYDREKRQGKRDFILQSNENH